MSDFITNQNWRYATKKFNAAKKISTQDLNTLKEAIRLSSSSYGLQPYKVIIVENPDLRAQLQPAAYGQAQVVDASHLIVFAHDTNVDDDTVNQYINRISETRNIPVESLAGFGDYMKGGINSMPQDVKNIWASKQTYLALGNLLNAAAELKIDITPMEGFVPAKVNEILGLDKLNLNASLMATIGYRHDEDATQHSKKVRKSNEELFITL